MTSSSVERRSAFWCLHGTGSSLVGKLQFFFRTSQAFPAILDLAPASAWHPSFEGKGLRL
jgi:hypothetical protein